MPRSLREVNVTPQQRKMLKSRERSRSISNGDALRARIVLLAAQGESAREIAERLGISVRSVYKWTRRFQEDGIEGLEDKSRSGRPRTVDADKIFEVLQKTLTQIPLGCTNWSIRLMADAVELLPSQVHSIWQQAGIKPHRTGTFKVSRDPNEICPIVVDRRPQVRRRPSPDHPRARGARRQQIECRFGPAGGDASRSGAAIAPAPCRIASRPSAVPCCGTLRLS